MKKFYLTTAIDYANDKPHLGHVLEKLQADAVARFKRLQGDKVKFVTGTDEHGLKNLRAAQKSGLSPQVFTARNRSFFKALKKELNLSWDDFIFTTDKRRHYRAVRKLWLKLAKKGVLKKKRYSGLYCVGCENFLTPKELVFGLCPIHQTQPEVFEEENWFFIVREETKQKVIRALEREELKIYPSHRTKEVVNALGMMPDVSFSRSKEKLPWGIPVPNDDSQVIYVWADALTNYLSAVNYAENRHRKPGGWWPADLHIIGKDILRFHASLWPLMLLEIGEKLPQAILAHGFVNLEGYKMSKSTGHFVEPKEILACYGLDPLRYYLLKEVSTQEDGNFSWNRFNTTYAKELADLLGNTLSRVLTMAHKYCSGRVPSKPKLLPNPLGKLVEDYREAFNRYELSRALSLAMEVISPIGSAIDTYRPWELIATRPKQVGGLLYEWLERLRLLSVLLYPFIPDTAQLIRKQLGLTPLQEKQQGKEYRWGTLTKGTKLNPSKILFPKKNHSHPDDLS